MSPGAWVAREAFGEERGRGGRGGRTGRALAMAALVLSLGGCTVGDAALDLMGFRKASQDPPDRFGFGTPASPERVAAWDVDVRPDGVGLPEGSGTVAEGAQVYRMQCVSCHGETGVEGPNDRLVGREPWEDFPSTRTVGNYWPYATTLFDYMVRAMPQHYPGSLSADDTYAVIAWLLWRNEIIPEDAVMDRTTLPAVVMPARDRFVPDNRTGGDTIR